MRPREDMIVIQDFNIIGIKLITPFYAEDERGYFIKYLERDLFLKAGLNPDVRECFEVYSKKQVIRGLHFQTVEPQAKLVRVVSGRIYDVAVDLRKGSPTFGKYTACELSSENRKGLWIAAGFAHGYQVLSEDAIVSYTCIGRYLKEYDTGIKWDDPELAISWSTTVPVVSERDNGLMSFKKFRESHGGF